MRFRVYVELEWFKKLFAEKIVSKDPTQIATVKRQHAYLDSIFKNFSQEDGERVKTIEKTTNHDVKAIEYFLKEKFGQVDELEKLKENLHFSCTSEDINNLSYSLMMDRSMEAVVVPRMRNLQGRLELCASDYADVPIMCRTHGQSATPSTVGKEFANFAYRMRR